MKDHGDGMESTTTRDGITVHQTYQKERFGVPTVALKLVSKREEPAEVRITVDLVPDLRIEEVGFHPEYGRENWTVDGDRLAFTDTIGPEEEVTTMYAVESLGDDQLDSLLENLSIENISDETPESKFDTRPGSQPGHSTGSDPAEDVSAEELATEIESDLEDDYQEGLAADSAESDDSTEEMAAETSDTEGEAETEHEDGAAPGEEEPVHDEEDEREQESEDGVGDEVGAEDDGDGQAQEGGIEDEDGAGDGADGAGTAAGEVAVSGEAPGVNDGAVGEKAGEDSQKTTGPATPELSGVSTATLLGELHNRMTDMERTVEVLEDFDTQHGRPVEAFAEIQDELAALDGRLDDIEEDVDSLAEGQDELESKVSTLREWRDQVRSTLSALGNQ